MFDLIIAFLIGSLLGSFYLTALWVTVRRIPGSPHPVVLLIGSYVARMGVVLAGFYFVMGGDWRRLVSCMVGFVAIRLILLRGVRPSPDDLIMASHTSSAGVRVE